MAAHVITPSPRLFRQHLQVETHPTASPLLRRLCEEWADLNTAPDTATSLRAWARRHPVLAGLDSPGAIVDHVDCSPRPVKDEVMRALLSLLHDGERLAGRVLLQAMLPCLTGLARRCHSPRGTQSPDEDLQRALTEFWGVIVRPRTLGAGIAGRLQLDTLHQLTSHRRSPDAWEEHTYLSDGMPHEDSPGADCGTGLETVADREDQDSTYDTAGGLLELLVSTRRRGVLSATEAQFLADVYLVAPGQSLAEAAAQLDLSATTVRQRCCRLRTKLIAAVLDDARETSNARAAS